MAVAVHGKGDSRMTELPSAGWAAIHASTELLIGASTGMVVRLSAADAEIAGGAIATPIGLSAAQAFDRTISAGSEMPRLLRNLALLVAVITGLHRVMLEAVVSSFHLVPAGKAQQPEATFRPFLELSEHVSRTGLSLALPLLAILLMASAALAFVAGAAPTLQIFNVGFAVLLGTMSANQTAKPPGTPRGLDLGTATTEKRPDARTTQDPTTWRARRLCGSNPHAARHSRAGYALVRQRPPNKLATIAGPCISVAPTGTMKSPTVTTTTTRKPVTSGSSRGARASVLDSTPRALEARGSRDDGIECIWLTG